MKFSLIVFICVVVAQDKKSEAEEPSTPLTQADIDAVKHAFEVMYSDWYSNAVKLSLEDFKQERSGNWMDIGISDNPANSWVK
jgi:hypothetical protein